MAGARALPLGGVDALLSPETGAVLGWIALTETDLTIATVPQRFAELGDLHSGIDDAVFTIDRLLEWAERDEREGAVDVGDPDDPME